MNSAPFIATEVICVTSELNVKVDWDLAGADGVAVPVRVAVFEL
jgi:hypothetical protein